MGKENALEESIRIADLQAGYDAACKKLLSEKIVLAWILKSCVKEFYDLEPEDIATRCIEGLPSDPGIPDIGDKDVPSRIIGSNTEDSTIYDGVIRYDIRFRAIVPLSDCWTVLLMNVEVQNDFYPGYPLVCRGIFYGGRMISSQYKTEFTKSHYEKLKKVYSIWICMNPPQYRRNSINCYEIHEEQLIGNVKESVQNYDMLTVIMICLGSPEDDNYEGILKLLQVLLSYRIGRDEKCRILQEEFEISMTQEIDEEVDHMCNLSEGLWKTAMEKGWAEGMEKGWTEGVEKGMEKGMEKGTVIGARQVNDLNVKLVESGRMNDMIRAAADRDYQQLLFAEFGI
ncbi:MAG: hypothetical protein LUE14_10410 [Clostridiales bacterium]|nr:hypothetical protein [Clostridiales bacterium]